MVNWRAWLAPLALPALLASHGIAAPVRGDTFPAGWWCVRIEHQGRMLAGAVALVENTNIRRQYMFAERNVGFVGVHSLDLRALGIPVPKAEELPIVSATILGRDSVMLELDALSPSIQLVGHRDARGISGRWWLTIPKPVSGAFTMRRGDPECASGRE